MCGWPSCPTDITLLMIVEQIHVHNTSTWCFVPAAVPTPSSSSWNFGRRAGWHGIHVAFLVTTCHRILWVYKYTLNKFIADCIPVPINFCIPFQCLVVILPWQPHSSEIVPSWRYNSWTSSTIISLWKELKTVCCIVVLLKLILFATFGMFAFFSWNPLVLSLIPKGEARTMTDNDNDLQKPTGALLTPLSLYLYNADAFEFKFWFQIKNGWSLCFVCGVSFCFKYHFPSNWHHVCVCHHLFTTFFLSIYLNTSSLNTLRFWPLIRFRWVLE